MDVKKIIPKPIEGQNTKQTFLPKVKLEIVLVDDQIERCIEVIIAKAKTGKIGDGKIFVSEVERAIRIRTSEERDETIQGWRNGGMEGCKDL